MAVKNEVKKTEEGMSSDTRSIIAVLALLFAYPIGVIVMWFMTKWPKWVKFLITAPLIIIPFIAIGLVALVVAINPHDRIEQAKKASCEQQCSKDASSSACVTACMDRYGNVDKDYYEISPTTSPANQY